MNISLYLYRTERVNRFVGKKTQRHSREKRNVHFVVQLVCYFKLLVLRFNAEEVAEKNSQTRTSLYNRGEPLRAQDHFVH